MELLQEPRTTRRYQPAPERAVEEPAPEQTEEYAPQEIATVPGVGSSTMPPGAVAHHFSNPTQQYRAAKLGMWLFLATEVILFAGLFCIYGLLRANKPEIFAWGHPILDKSLGSINTLLLIGSSITMGLAVRAAKLHRRRLLISMLTATLLAGAGFLCIKGVEYGDKIHFGLMPGDRFNPNLKYVAVCNGATRKQLRDMINIHGPVPAGLRMGDPKVGGTLFAATCAGCHGTDGSGKPNQGANLQASRFIAGKTDEALLAFVRVGRLPTDPNSVLKLTMPSRGGNPTLNDQKLLDIISYLRTFHQEQQVQAMAAQSPASDASAAAPPRKILSDFAPPPREALFFSIYYILTGLHGLHVLAGLGVVAWLLSRAWRGHFDRGYATPVELGGMYWYLVDLIWLILFPLLYLS
jgi:cytochrome c oxidase subunit III